MLRASERNARNVLPTERRLLTPIGCGGSRVAPVSHIVQIVILKIFKNAPGHLRFVHRGVQQVHVRSSFLLASKVVDTLLILIARITRKLGRVIADQSEFFFFIPEKKLFILYSPTATAHPILKSNDQ